ncbi:WbqC family protein, partial [Candidatus Omnitrophota bacterium]
MKKILTAHQPVYLPWLGLFHKIALADTFVIFDTAQYLKKDWNNRNKIKSEKGPIWLTVPVYTKSRFTQCLVDVRINNTLPWRRKHLRSIEINYKKAPYFNDYIGFFRNIYSKEWDSLADLNNEILIFLLDAFGIKVKILHGHDLGLEGSKSDLVLDMCKKLNADLYIFGALGKDYAKVEDFESNNIKLHFQDYKHPVYNQQFGDFVSHLSAIDLLFNEGKKSLQKIM